MHIIAFFNNRYINMSSIEIVDYVEEIFNKLAGDDNTINTEKNRIEICRAKYQVAQDM